MFNGTGVPAIVYKGEIIELPRPKADGRESNYEPLNDPYENLDGELIPRIRANGVLRRNTSLQVFLQP